MEIANGVYAYRGRPGEKIRPGAGSANVVVVRGDSLLMIDTGVTRGGAFRQLVEGMQADGLNPAEVSWIVHTHGHWDHINADRAVCSMARAGIGAGKEEVPWIEDAATNFRAFVADFGELRREVFPYPLAFGRAIVWIAWGRQPRLKVDRALSDGETIDIGRTVRALHTPGHSPGHMAYLVPDAGVLVLGDLVDFESAQGMDLNNPHSDYGAAVRSLEKVIPLGPEIILPGHGEPMTDRTKARGFLEKALAGGREYPDRVGAVLGAEPIPLKEITRRVFPGIPFSLEAMTRMLVLNVLVYLEGRGEVRRVRTAGRIGWERLD